MGQLIRSIVIVLMFFTAMVGVLAGQVQAEQARRKAVTVVILPSRGRGASLLLICDRLAEALGKTKFIRVVDRTQLDRVLQERKTAPKPIRSMLAYDLMVRMRVDSLRSSLSIELIDLSTGNVVAGRQYDWQAKPDKKQLSDMVKLCHKAAEKVVRAESRPLRVRLLGVANVGHSPRLEPMAAHLADIIKQTVSRSSRCVIVRHLEAMTSKEESLLIHMGLSRLAGGRRFLPQADVIVEAQIEETQKVGKTFKQTPLEVRFRLTRRGQKPSEWETVAATVADWERMIRQMCQGLAKKLGQTDPVPFGDYAVEMVHRRRQAEAELAAAKKLGPANEDWVTMNRRSGKIEVSPVYARIAAAVKLDPTYEEAAYRLACAWPGGGKERANENRATKMAECLRYLRRFEGHRGHRSSIVVSTCLTANDYFIDLRKEASSAKPMTPERLRTLAVLRDILDMLPNKKDIVFHGVSRDTYGRLTSRAVNLVYRGSRHAGVSLAECRQWLEQYSKRFDEVFGTDQVDLLVLQLTYAIDDSNWRRARQVMDAVLTRTPRGKSARLEYLGEQLRRQVVRMKDDKLRDRAGSWLESVQTGVRPVGFLSIRPPQLYLFEQKWDKDVADWTSYHDRKWWSAAPVLLHNGWIYLVTSGGRWEAFRGSARGSFARIRVDGRGRPKDKIKSLKGAPKGIHPQDFAARGNRVFFGTMGDGLYEFNDKTRKWRSWGARDGFPVRSVHKVWPLDDKTLLLFGQDAGWDTRRLFTLNIESGEVRILRRKSDCYSLRTSAVWERNGKLMALLKEGLVTDLLGEAALTDFALTPGGRKVSLKGVGPPGTTVIGKRRWLKCGGLYELAENGRVVRNWSGRAHSNSPASDKHGDTMGIRPVFTGISSMRFQRLIADASHLFLVDDAEILCYDPAKDTWYGPIVPGHTPSRVVGAPGGIWIGTGRGPAFVDTARFIEKARAMGRALTSSQLKKRQQKLIEASPPLKRAKFQIVQRRFSSAVIILAAALEKEPDNAEILLLMGFVHDAESLNELDEAMKYYSRLAAMENNPSARMTGLRAQFTVLLCQKKWKQATDVGETFEKEFPRVIWDGAGKIRHRLLWARKQLAKGEK